MKPGAHRIKIEETKEAFEESVSNGLRQKQVSIGFYRKKPRKPTSLGVA